VLKNVKVINNAQMVMDNSMHQKWVHQRDMLCILVLYIFRENGNHFLKKKVHLVSPV